MKRNIAIQSIVVIAWMALAACAPSTARASELIFSQTSDGQSAYGLNRGGIDGRWFASTTASASEAWGENLGLSCCVVGQECYALRFEG